MHTLSSARYGKENIRVYKVRRDEETGVQTVVEMTVSVLLEGEIETSYVFSNMRLELNEIRYRSRSNPH